LGTAEGWRRRLLDHKQGVGEKTNWWTYSDSGSGCRVVASANNLGTECIECVVVREGTALLCSGVSSWNMEKTTGVGLEVGSCDARHVPDALSA